MKEIPAASKPSTNDKLPEPNGLDLTNNIKSKPKVWWENETTGNIEGRCKSCHKPVRAMGLIPIPDRMVFGRFREGGWYCSICQPRQFGRIGGKPSLGIPISPGYKPKPTE